MGTYYQYVNLDKYECISLHYICNIKSGAFERWSLQTAILNTFLGFSWRGNLNLGAWVGRWAGDRVELRNDSKDYDDEDEGQSMYDPSDIGMEFVEWLYKRDDSLYRFLTAAGLYFSEYELDVLKTGKWKPNFDVRQSPK